MSSFQDRFKDKAQIVGKDGEGAMLTHQDLPTKRSKKSTPSTAEDASARSSNPRSARAGHPLIPEVPGHNNSYHDHIRALAQGTDGDDSTNLQMAHAKYGRRAPHPMSTNVLVDTPHEPMKFNRAGYRNKDELKPVEPDPAKPPHDPTYTPYTVHDWRQKNAEPIIKGGVGRLASDTDDQRLYRALRSRVKEFSSETDTVNKVMLAPENRVGDVTPLAPPRDEDLLEKTARRQKALEFAKHVPRPKVAHRVADSDSRHLEEDDPEYDDERRQNQADIDALEEKHRRDQAALNEMRKKLAL